MLTLNKVYRQHKESAKTWKRSCRTAGGKLKRNIYYGEKLAGKLDAQRALIWFGRAYTPETYDASSIKGLIDALGETLKVSIYAEDKKFQKKLGKDFADELVSKDKEATALLATCGVIVSVTLLPTYYRKREGQLHVHLVTPYEFGTTKFERSSLGLAQLLNADWVICDSQDNGDKLAEMYQLAEAYTGSVVCAGADKTVAQLAKQIVSGETDGLEGLTFTQSKPHLLIYCDCYPVNHASDYCLHILSLIDLDKVDVTVMIQSYDGAETALSLIDALDPRVRVLGRSGSFSCDEKNYIALQVINEVYQVSDDAAELLPLIPMDALEGEINRIFASMRFDSLIYCAKERNLWKLLSLAIPAKRKTMLQLEYWSCVLPDNCSELYAQRYYNRAKTINYVFDSVCFANEELQSGLTPNLPDCKTFNWCIDLPLIQTAIGDSSHIKEAVFNDHTRGLLIEPEQQASMSSVKALMYEPLPKDLKCYLCHADSQTIAQLSEIEDLIDDSFGLFLFLENAESISTKTVIPPNKDNVKLIDCEIFTNMSTLCSYIKMFDGYLELGEDASALKQLAMSLGVPLYKLDDNGLSSVRGAQINDAREYNAVCREKVFELFFGETMPAL